MAKEKEQKDPEVETQAQNREVSLTAEDIIRLVSALQDKNSSTLAQALEKLSPHYKSPEQKQFDETAKAQQRDIEIMKIKRRKRQERTCEHEIGQTGRKRLGEGAFNMLRLPTGETIGVCTYCQKVISSANPDHIKFFRKAGGVMAEAGQFTLTDPIKAQLARLTPEEREKVLKAREQYQANSPAQDELEEELI